jgi:hypothetical protein
MDSLASYLALAQSTDFEERARAGVALAPHAGNPRVDSVLIKLLVDDADTWVTQATTEALIRDGRRPAVRVLLSAIAAAEQAIGLATDGGVRQAGLCNLEEMDSTAFWEDDDNEYFLKQPVLEELAEDSDEGVRRGARDLLERMYPKSTDEIQVG